ncbi:MAG: hypothetical protein PHY47_04390 [Lachnospiraceae bacterium]|nr:hypothetical protein [Lachnospiraceae bacterium]
MAINDEIREQQQKLKDMNFKKKISYILYYYKYPILITFFVFVLLISSIHSIVTRKDTVFYCVMINSTVYNAKSDELMKAFSEDAQIDLTKKDVMIDCSMQINYEEAGPQDSGYAQKILVLLNAGDIDVMIADEPVINNYSSISAFKDLGSILSEDIIKQLDEKFDFYYQIGEDGSKIPIGIIIANSKVMKDGNFYSSNYEPILSITSNTKHPETVIKFINYLLENE